MQSLIPAILVIGEEDNDFGANDYILFYGSNRNGLDKNAAVQASLYHNPYSLNTVYWLTYGSDFSGSPLRITNSPTHTTWATEIFDVPVQIRVEEETHRRENEGFGWFMSKFFGQGNSQYQYLVSLDDVETDSTQSLSVSLIQETTANVISHKISVSVNGALLYHPGVADSTRFSWSGSGEYLFSENTKRLISGSNDIKINVYRSGTDNLFLDYFVYSYRKRLIKNSNQYIFSLINGNSFLNTKYTFTGNKQDISVFQIYSLTDVYKIPVTTTASGFYFISSGLADSKCVVTQNTDWMSPVLVQKYSPLDLADAGIQIDNLIICPSDFSEQAETLKQFYWSNYRIRSKVVTQEQIFDQFNGGHPDPAAIKQYARFAYASYLAPRLTSLTLLGTGTIDWRNFSRQAAEKNKLMVYQKGRDVSDDYLAMINTPLYPELAIGRYPVKNVTELNVMLGNLRNYVEQPVPGWWRNTMLFVADDLYNGSSSSNEYIHTQQAQSSASQIHRSMIPEKVFGMEYDYDEFQNKPKAREDMFKYINEGTLAWLYIGHGSFDKLGAEDYLDGASDLVRFTNNGKLPLFIAASCQIAHFDYWGYESLAQKIVMMNDLGSIATIAGTRETYPYNNAPLTNAFLNQSINLRNRLGYSLLTAKIIYTQNNSNDEKYIIFGDPLVQISPPERDSTFSIFVDEQPTQTLRSRQIPAIAGTFTGLNLQGIAGVQAYNSEAQYNLGPLTDVSKRGSMLFKGTASVENSRYTSSFVVPDDVLNGNTSKVIAYFWDSNRNKDFVNYSFPITLSDKAVTVVNTDVPSVNIYLDNQDFRNGDTVGSHPILYANISDANGINITGSPGHNILLILDNSSQPLSVTDYFAYDLDSYTSGLLTYPMSNLSEGAHTIQLIAFDNFNSPAVANANFLVKKLGDLSIERLLPYPNPMSKDGHITFMLSQNADLTIGIYTMSGKKIRSIKAIGKPGFNQIYWDGKDGDGDRLANNTYFVKVKAKNAGKSVEKIERIVIYK
ncbi:MAG: hypothetical protein CVU48_08075 [Candidatus Cloacimonetes bacterium HGW-Cloacimonetes-1]|nr:MAG: hypothetical protein CVU48_08075 [Candidatus Cloacimonetes bacterium HGW-Cloacimonetes-1]